MISKQQEREMDIDMAHGTRGTIAIENAKISREVNIFNITDYGAKDRRSNDRH
jgi:hypothetical protein